MREAVILSAVRTPTGRFLGSLKGFTAPQLGSLAPFPRDDIAVLRMSHGKVSALDRR